MAKHSTIYPSSHDLEAVQSLVSTVEGALKHVSDWLDHQSNGSDARSQADGQSADSKPAADGTENDDPGDDPSDEAEDSNDSYRYATGTDALWDILSVIPYLFAITILKMFFKMVKMTKNDGDKG